MTEAKRAFHSVNFVLVGVALSGGLTPWFMGQGTSTKWGLGAGFAAAMMMLTVRCLRIEIQRWAKATLTGCVAVYLLSIAVRANGGWEIDTFANAHSVVLLLVLIGLIGVAEHLRRNAASADEDSIGSSSQ